MVGVRGDAGDAEDDADVLQAAVRVEQLGADRADAGSCEYSSIAVSHSGEITSRSSLKRTQVLAGRGRGSGVDAGREVEQPEALERDDGVARALERPQRAVGQCLAGGPGRVRR